MTLLTARWAAAITLPMKLLKSLARTTSQYNTCVRTNRVVRGKQGIAKNMIFAIWRVGVYNFIDKDDNFY